MRNTKAISFGAGVALTLVIGGGITYAAIPGPAGVINACYKSSGVLRVIYPGRRDHPDYALARKLMPDGAGNMIGLELDGLPRNFVTFRPRKSFVIMHLKLPPQGDETRKQLEEAGIETLTYDVQFGQFRVKIDPALIAKQRNLLLHLTRQAWEGFGKT